MSMTTPVSAATPASAMNPTAAAIAAAHIDRALIVQVPRFAADHRRSWTEADIGDLAERHLDTICPTHENPPDLIGAVPEILRIADGNGVTLPTFNRRRDLLAAQRHTDYLLSIARRKSVAGERVCIRPDIEIAAAE